MIEITHHIQKSILKYLTKQQTARYSQMRPPKVDSNLYAYHLKSLLKTGFIIKNNKGQTLSTEKFLNVSELRVWGRDNFIEIFSFVIGDRKLDSKTLNELTNLATIALMNKNIK